jgi:hypothetical protein
MQLFSAEVPYGTGKWDSGKLGNHRVVIEVNKEAGAVKAHIPWRRRDNEPEKKGMILMDGHTQKEVANILPVNISRESGDILFQPVSGPGEYYLYYMPHTTTGRKNYPTVKYLEPRHTADKSWLAKWKSKFNSLPQAAVKEIQSIDKFNSFYPMEVIATAEEVKGLVSKHNKKSFLLFPEDRAYPIRMTGDLPYRWIKRGARSEFEGEAAKGEYYAFQVGVYAVQSGIKDIYTRFTDLRRVDGNDWIPAAALRCFNVAGTDWTGKAFDKVCAVEKGKIQALWFGVQVPETTEPASYEGTVTITPKDMQPQQVKLRLRVTGKVLADRGDSEPWRHSRLRWLDSKIALDNEPEAPDCGIDKTEKDGQTVVLCAGRNLTIGAAGLPKAINSEFIPANNWLHNGPPLQILAAPMELKIEDETGKAPAWTQTHKYIGKPSGDELHWTFRSTAASGKIEMTCDARMELDGFVAYRLFLEAKEDIKVNDIRLEIPYSKDAATYFMGLGIKGGYRPNPVKWKWDVKKNQDGAWLGAVNGGMQFSLRGKNYSRPLNTNFYQQKPLNMPVSWTNNGKGGIDIEETGNNTVLVTAYSGKRFIKKGETLHYYVNLLITPFKLLDTRKQWTHRFFHRFKPLKEIKSRGANTVNVHHATEINPFINYPFIRPKQMKAYIDEAHKMDMKVKIYYTVRELSNIAPELFALRSLGDEILSYGKGGGFAWLQEHLGGNYIAGWLVPHYKDAAVINSGVSRWHNYYLEGLNWLVKNVGIDGIYIDDVAFDRTVMKRVRKILDRGGKGKLIDLHSANQYNPRDGFANSANLYLEHFPYIDRLWFGEYFDYDSAPDFWLVEVSGIPFGLMGEMLQDGGNPWRGMIYGMTSRMPWAGDPSPLWKAWDDFGIAKSDMVGYWSPDCPVKTDHKDVLATVYEIHGKRSMIALASWAKTDVKVNLQIDWKALGLNKATAALTAPAIDDFQTAASFKPGEAVPIPKAKGLLLIITSNLPQ